MSDLLSSVLGALQLSCMLKFSAQALPLHYLTQNAQSIAAQPTEDALQVVLRLQSFIGLGQSFVLATSWFLLNVCLSVQSVMCM